jgi:hypothetical protein
VASRVAYLHSFAYLSDPDSGKSFPGLWVQVSIPGNADRIVDTSAHLDTGSELSVFDGKPILRRLGIDLMAGPEIVLSSSAGFSLTARIHQLELSHPELGRFTLDAAISTVPIARNLLGRDFFEQIQIGIREFHHTFFITAAP